MSGDCCRSASVAALSTSRAVPSVVWMSSAFWCQRLAACGSRIHEPVTCPSYSPLFCVFETNKRNGRLAVATTMAPSRTVKRSSLTPAEQQQALDRLCTWIETHLDEPIGWQQMMGESGLDFQTINALFYRHKSTTPMTWIRRLREARAAGQDALFPEVVPGAGP